VPVHIRDSDQTLQSANHGNEMAASLGEILYWTASVIAGLIVAAVVIGYVSNTGEGLPIIPIIALLVAGVIWLVGGACRRMLARR
jgi:formate/nitrite transporter FocA (FNT family)